ncbi:MAG: hypothetical protein JXA33_16760 [Anaerolineae bacterium]|nr:hypothetical protein [Anaerolineae bacterium]
MRIESLRSETKGDCVRIAATVIWEDCDRPQQTVYYETDKIFAQDLTCNPHAFLVGCVIPARRHGEQRVAIDEAVCPELVEGLEIAMRWLDSWQGKPPRPVVIETRKGIRLPALRSREWAGAFLSGGLDSLALLRANRNRYSPEHPRYMRDGLIVHGFDIGGLATHDTESVTFQRAMAAMTPIAEDANLTLIPVHTNIRHLDDDVHFWIYEFHGAALASVAHAFSKRFSLASVAAGWEIPDIQGGSHPMLIPNYSSTDLRMRLEGSTLSRLAKARLISDWDVALQNLRVCTHNPTGRLNCGTCEKCIRTMTELVAVGKLSETEAFGAQDVSVELLETIRVTQPYLDAFYHELIQPLADRGRRDLVEVIERKLAEHQRYLAWTDEKDWKGIVKRFDRKWLGGRLFKGYSTAHRGFRNLAASSSGKD